MFVRKFATLLLALSLTLSLAGCMNAGDQAETTAAPAARSAVTAEPTGVPGSVDKTGGQAFNWQTEAQKVEQSINQLSEVSESWVAISGNTALVGVKFDSAYQGEMTDRIREMISGLVKQADPNIQVVAVTATEEDVNKIFEISDRVRGGGAFENFKDDIVGIVRNITTLR